MNFYYNCVTPYLVIILSQDAKIGISASFRTRFRPLNHHKKHSSGFLPVQYFSPAKKTGSLAFCKASI